MPRERLIAALDIGPVSVTMLLVRLAADGTIIPINEFVAQSNLAGELFKTKSINEEAMLKTIQAAKEMQTIADREGVANLIVTACSAIRLAENRSRFLLKCNSELNIFPQVMSPKDEARLSFLGASMSLKADQPIVTIVPGFFSSEAAFGTKDVISGAVSMDTGAQKLAIQSGARSPLNIFKTKNMQNIISKELQKLSPYFDNWLSYNKHAQVIATGPIAMAYAGLNDAMSVYEIQASAMIPGNTDSLLATCKNLEKQKNRPHLPGAEHNTSEQISCGLTILHNFLTQFKIKDFYVSNRGIRCGIIRYFLDSHR